MPLYAFACKKCGHSFELKLSMQERDSAAISCPECESEDCGQLFDKVNVCAKSTAGGKAQPGPGCGCCNGACGLNF